MSERVFSYDLRGIYVQVSYEAALWGLYVTKTGEWIWLENGLVQLAMTYAQANRILGLTGMTEPGAAELVNALELGVFEAERRNGELEAAQNRSEGAIQAREVPVLDQEESRGA